MDITYKGTWESNSAGSVLRRSTRRPSLIFDNRVGECPMTMERLTAGSEEDRTDGLIGFDETPN